MDKQEFINQNISYFTQNECFILRQNDERICFLCDILNFDCVDYNTKITINTCHAISEDDIHNLLSYDSSNIVKARILTYLIKNETGYDIKNNINETISLYQSAFDDYNGFEYKCSCLNMVILLSKIYKISYSNFIKEKITELINIDRRLLNLYDVNLLKAAFDNSIVDYEKAITNCKENMKQIINTNFFIFGKYYDLALHIVASTYQKKQIKSSKNDDFKNSIFILKSTLYEKLGDEEKCNIKKGLYYLIALVSYKKIIRLPKLRLVELKHKMEQCQKLSLEDMYCITEKLDCEETFNLINKKIDSTKDDELIYLLSEFNGLLSESKQISKINENMKNYKLSYLFSTKMVNADGKEISKSRCLTCENTEKNDKERLMEHVHNHVYLDSEYFGQVILYIIFKLKEKKQDYNADIEDIVNKSYIIIESRKKIVTKGLIFGFNLDFESALCILIPQFENAIRILADFCGDTIYKTDSDSKESVNSLEHYFKDRTNLKNSLEENIFFTIDSVFVNQNGLNFRNEVAHGIKESFSNYSSIYARWVILYTIATFS